MQLYSEKQTNFGGTVVPLFLQLSRELRCCSNASNRLAGAYSRQQNMTHSDITHRQLQTTHAKANIIWLPNIIQPSVISVVKYFPFQFQFLYFSLSVSVSVNPVTFYSNYSCYWSKTAYSLSLNAQVTMWQSQANTNRFDSLLLHSHC